MVRSAEIQMSGSWPKPVGGVALVELRVVVALMADAPARFPNEGGCENEDVLYE